MAENRSLSSSEQYIKKSNRRLLFIGLGLLLAFLIALALIPSKQTSQQQEDISITGVSDVFGEKSGMEAKGVLPYGENVKLVSNPDKVEMNNVVLGSKAEALIVLTAKNAPILFREWDLAETQQDGFSIETTCVPSKPLAIDETCNVKVLWNPVELRRISNILNIKWRVDSTEIYREETLSIPLSAQSTDSKDCVICETAAAEADKKLRQAMLLNGQLADIDEDGYITLGDKTYKVDANGNLLDENGNPTGMKLIGNKLYDKNGNLIGTVGEDGYIRDEYGNIIGKVNPDGSITLFGNGATYKVLPDGTVVDANGNVIGKLESLGSLGFLVGCDVVDKRTFKKIASVMADGSIVDLNGELFATIASDGTLRDKNGVYAGDISGTGPKLAKCGINLAALGNGTRTGLGSGTSTSGRRIFIGQKAYTIDSNGSLVAEDGTVIGYMGQDGRPYSLSNKVLTAGAGSDGSGRTRPNLSQKMPVDPAQVEQMQQLLAQKRQGMKGGIKNAIRPAGKLLARSKKKQDEHWAWGRIVSSWPVKMTNVILKDKAIPAVLVRSIDSRYTDVPVTAIVERHIYSEEGRNIMIPAGSRIIGKMSGNAGENHVAKMEISWERLIRPDGGAFAFSATSGDAQGRGGVAAYLDEQLLAKYGKPILSSSVTSLITYMAARYDPVETNNETDTTTQSDASKAAQDARETFRDNMEQIFQQLIDAATEIPPVVFVPAGTRITVFSNEDLWLRSEEEDERDYEAQFGPDSKSARGTGGSSWVDKRGTPAEQIAAGGTQGNAAANTYYEPEDAYYGEDATGSYTVDQTAYEEQLANEGVLYGEDDVVIDQNDYIEPTPSSGNIAPVASQNNSPAGSDLANRVSKPVLPKASKSSGKMF